MKILSIGNSFSQDAHRYLHDCALANNKDLKCVNLYIGGCSLKRHYHNMLDDEEAYMMGFNGETTNFYVSIREALKSDDWDFVTLQQASHESFNFDNYTPYIESLADYIRKYLPKTKILIHQTWAYQDGSERLKKMGYQSTKAMFDDIKSAYEMASDAAGAFDIIPSGQAMLYASYKNSDTVYRDTFHAGLGFGRYLIALVWLKKLFKLEKISHITDFDFPVSEKELLLIEEILNKMNL